MLSPASITMVSICSGGGEADWAGAGGGGSAGRTTFLFLPLRPFPGVRGEAAVSVTTGVPPTSPVATLRGRVSPLGSWTTFAAMLFDFCTLGQGLIATVFCGVTGVVAAAGTGEVTGVVMMAWLVPGISWIWPPWGITWICGTTWYWMLAGPEVLLRAGLCWIVRTMGLPGPVDPKPAESWITLPFAERKPKFFGGAGAIGAGFIGWSLRGWGCTGGEEAGACAAGGPILLQVAARRARGEGCVSCWENKHR